MEKIQEKEEQKERLYLPKEVAGLLELETDLLRKYTDHFNVQTEWTKANRKGHRRYTQKNIEELAAIRDKIKNQGWTWDQVLAWRNGEEEQFIKNHEEKSNLEKKMDQLLEEQKVSNERLERQEQFNQILVQQIAEYQKQLAESRNEVAAMKEYIDNRLNKRDQLLIESIRQTQEDKKTPWIKRLFGG